MKKIRELPLELAEKFDLPGDVLPGTGCITVIGGKQAKIEGHRGILEYSGERLVVALMKGKISVGGSGLSLQAMTALELIVAGRIDCVEWI